MADTKTSDLTPLSPVPRDAEFHVASGASSYSATPGEIIGAQSYAEYLCCCLEPDAIEAVQTGTFTYAVGSSETKVLLASWATRLNSSANGRMEMRQPGFMPMRDCTLYGSQSSSTALILDPSLGTYTDAWDTYYSRKLKIAQSSLKTIHFSSTGEKVPLLGGAYGGIILQYTCFDFTWIAIRPLGGSSFGVNLGNEISDVDIQRVGEMLVQPFSKGNVSHVESSSIGTAPNYGTVAFILCDSTWSTIPDPVSSSYTFRDDFMASVLNTTNWTRAESTAGNVEIDTNYQWLQVKGNSVWGSNGAYRTTTVSRAANVTMVMDVYLDASGAELIVGWSDALGHSNTNFAHGVGFKSTHAIRVYENGTDRGIVGAGFSEHTIYRVKIVLNVGGSATYSIQGGTQYGAIGSATWTNITPGTSNSATSAMSPAVSAYASTNYASDARVY